MSETNEYCQLVPLGGEPEEYTIVRVLSESDRTRTCDLCNVNATFYQLNYGFYTPLILLSSLAFYNSID